MSTLTAAKIERQNVNFRIPLHLLAKIDQRSAETGLNRTSVVISLLDRGLECTDEGHPAVLRNTRAA